MTTNQVIHEKLVKIASNCDATVLITGPTGSGKSRLARSIHDRSSRSSRPFITVNLATLYEGTLESELFGHERGAFTGADQRRIGRLELANGGTVFLDEIAELSPRLQARLLEFLQSKVVVPVGGNREISLDVRIVAATHQNLYSAVAQGRFREDLFHRLRLLCLELKPLSERTDEFDHIVHSCIEELCRRSGRTVLRLSEAVAVRLENYSWPGNFRELRNVLEFAVLAGEGPEIEECDLPPWFGTQPFGQSGPSRSGEGTLGVAQVPLSLNYETTVSSFEKEYLERALSRYHYRINETARRIGLNKTTLIRRLRLHGIHGIRTEKQNNALQ